MGQKSARPTGVRDSGVAKIQLAFPPRTRAYNNHRRVIWQHVSHRLHCGDVPFAFQRFCRQLELLGSFAQVCNGCYVHRELDRFVAWMRQLHRVATR